MAFPSLTLGLFVAATLLVYYRVPGRMQWQVLLLAGWGFLLCQGPESLPFLLVSALTTYLSARWMGRRQGKAARKPGLILCLAVNFGTLALCKGFGFLPLGLSFYTFQGAGYVIDVYRGKAEAENDFLRHYLFLGWFPQLIQGPISRREELHFGIQKYSPKNLAFGFQRTLWGCFKKLVIADRIAPAVGALTDCEGLGFLLLTVFYAIQIYADFTGGIDMALGISQCFGISLPENFRSPFRAKNIADYWRRWHMTLGAWMKDYVFYPVSVSGPLRRLSKTARRRWPRLGKRLPVYAATLATWVATGLWHGITPNFLTWGLLNCTVIVISQELTPLYRKFHETFHWKDKPWYGCFEIARMFLLMNLIRACDLFPNVSDYGNRIGSLLTPWRWSLVLPDLGLTPADWWVLVLGIGVLVTAGELRQRQGSLRQLLWSRPALRDWLTFALLLALLLLGKYGPGYDAAAFIYNQF